MLEIEGIKDLFMLLLSRITEIPRGEWRYAWLRLLQRFHQEQFESQNKDKTRYLILGLIEHYGLPPEPELYPSLLNLRSKVSLRRVMPLLG